MPAFSLSPPHRQSLSEQVGSQLIEMIAAASDPEVTLPPERDLGEQLGVSRNVLREALAALQQAEIIHTRGKRRIGAPARARTMLMWRSSGENQTGIESVAEVRRLLEPEAAALAAERATPGMTVEISRWNSLLAEAQQRGESGVEHDSAFHISIARAAQNPMMIEIVGLLADAYRLGRERSFHGERAAEQAIEEHEAIIEALRARDPARARVAMRAHLDQVTMRINAARTAPGSLDDPAGPGRN